ncbi:MAG: glycosyltransferase family 4 protein [Acidobacteria bacterium]|jgi:glycosyltransferase involved in cell wall biosynthesis|nr:glycosyltransferase family 4 protein [Acidobacteriota bacterium]
MRVLYVNPFAQQLSGPDESLIGLLRGLRGGVEPFVVLPPGNPHVGRYEAAGATVIEVPMQRIRRTTRPGMLLAYAGLFAPETLRFVQLIRRHQIDLVHTNMEVILQSGLAARIAGRPSVYHVRGTSFASPRRVCDAVVGAINKLADEIIVISEAVGEIFYERGIRDKVSVVYNSLDPAMFDNPDASAVTALRGELAGGTEGPLVATVGRINPRKGLECFIEAATLIARSHGSVRFAIVGDAADDSERAYLLRLREMAERAGVNARLVFAPARRNIAQLMNAIDIFVMASINEGFGRVVIEAMAARRPVIASKVGGIPEIVVEGVTGRLVQPDKPEAFARAVSELLSNPDMLSQMGAEGRRRVATHFSDAAQVPSVMRIYRRVLRRPGEEQEMVEAP